MALEPSTLLDTPDHRTADTAAADRVFDSLERGSGGAIEKLSHSGRQWLQAALDPFTDYALEVSGQPSFDQQRSIVQVIKRSKTFTAPVAGSQFDLHVTTLPIDTTSLDFPQQNPLRAVQRVGNTNQLTVNALQTGTLGMVTVASASRLPAAGSSSPKLFPDAQGPPTVAVTYAGISPTDTVVDGTGRPIASNHFCDGLHRIVSAGFEIIVTTPVLYRGGLLTAYAQATREQQYYANITSDVPPGSIITPYCDAVLSRGPPPDANAALLLPGSRQWRAEEGAYVVLTQNGWDNPFVQPTSVLRVFDGKDAYAVSDAAAAPYSGLTSFVLQPSTLPVIASAPLVNTSSTPFSTKGCILERLHAESVVTVNLTVIMERVPTLSETDLVVLARPSPAYDELAWRFYSEAVRHMPIAVPLMENFTGGWFKGVAATISKSVKAAAPVAKVIAKTALPLAGPKGAALAHVIEEIENAQARKKLKPKQKAKPRAGH